MAWSYDETALGVSTAAERLNAVRYLVGDTDTNNQQVQNEEIVFSLSEAGDNIYYAASHVASSLASKYSAYVTTELDGALRVEYNELAKGYKNLAGELRQQGKQYNGKSMGVYYGGTSKATIDGIRENTDRIGAFFTRDQFRNPENDYNKRDYEG